MNNYTERLELPDGQWAVLLTRLPADRAQMVRFAIAREQDTRRKNLRGDDPVFIEAVTKAVLLECSVKDYLTGETVTDIAKADPRVSDAIQAKAFVLYVAWSTDAYPGPKDSTGTDSQTPNTETTAVPSETSEQR